MKRKTTRLEDTPKKKRPKNIKAPTFEPNWNGNFRGAKPRNKQLAYKLRNDVV